MRETQTPVIGEIDEPIRPVKPKSVEPEIRAIENQRKTAMKALNPKQKRFVEAYLVTGNGTQSAITAGYSPLSAHTNSCRMLKFDYIKTALELSYKLDTLKYGHSMSWKRHQLDCILATARETESLSAANQTMKLIMQLDGDIMHDHSTTPNSSVVVNIGLPDRSEKPIN